MTNYVIRESSKNIVMHANLWKLMGDINNVFNEVFVEKYNPPTITSRVKRHPDFQPIQTSATYGKGDKRHY